MIKPLIFGISGLELTRLEKDFFNENKIYGFILFKRNIQSKEQLAKLIDSLKALYPDRKLPIFVDQEGGRVARIKPPIAKCEYPTFETFGLLYDTDLDLALAKAKTSHLALTTELKSLGIDSGCAPVADLRFAYTDNVIGDRSFGAEVKKVVELCNASIKGIKDAEGLVVIKHIPGHGRALCDSHQELPIVSTSLEELNKNDFEVFRQLSLNENIDFAMTAHIVFEALDSQLPVTLSPKAIRFIREDIGFKGLLMSDDICMKALHANIDHQNQEEAYLANLKLITTNALKAGCDIVLHCSGNINEMREVVKEV